jgi:CBS domain-containing protein
VEKTLVREVMTPDPVTVAETESLKNAVSKMMERGVSSLVVADGTRAAGVLTARDVFEACAAIPAERVSIYGLREEEKVLKQSIFEEISLLAELLKKSMPLDSIALHVRSVVEGRKKRFEVRARASVGGRIFAASAPDIDARKQEWNLHLAVKEVLQELERILEKKFRRKPSRDTRERFEESVP